MDGHRQVPLRTVLCDLDGTLLAGESPLPGAGRAIDQLRAQGLTLRFLSNIDSRPPESVLALVRGFGIDVAADELVTPIVAALRLFSVTPPPRVLPVVSEALLPVFASLDPGDGYDHVVVGDCADRLDYTLLDRAFRALRQGAALIALQRGRYFKRDDGDHIDTGATVAALEYAAGISARTLGKPERDFFELALAGTDARGAGVLVVGDDAFADVGGGTTIGARTVLVRTGKYQDNVGIAGAPSPDFVIDSIVDLPALTAQLTG